MDQQLIEKVMRYLMNLALKQKSVKLRVFRQSAHLRISA